MTTRDEIISEALTWVGTPYIKKGTPIKGKSSDCASLLLGVGKAVGIFSEPSQMPPYQSNRHLFKTDQEYVAQLIAHGFTQINPKEAQAGDVVLFVMGNSQPASHTAILVENDRMVHAWQTVRKVALNRFDERWRKRARYAFRFPGIES